MEKGSYSSVNVTYTLYLSYCTKVINLMRKLTSHNPQKLAKHCLFIHNSNTMNNQIVIIIITLLYFCPTESVT